MFVKKSLFKRYYLSKGLMFVSLVFVLFVSLFVCISILTIEAQTTINVGDQTTLRDAVTNAVGPTVISLNADITLTSTALSIPNGKDITLTSNRVTGFYRLNGPSGVNTITVANGGRLTLAGITVTHSGTNGRGVNINSGGTLTLSGGTISGNTLAGTGDTDAYRGGGVFNNGGSFTITGGTISGNTAYRGGGVFNNGGSFTLSNGTISANRATGFGGGIYSASNTNFNIHGGTLSDNTADDNGGGIYNNVNFTISGGVISNNTAANWGGGIHNNSTGTVNLSGGTITNNTARRNTGGGVYSAGTLNMYSGSIYENTANSSGGGAYIAAAGRFSLSGGTISNNTANYGSGGGVFNAGSFTMSNATIFGNTARIGEGGGIVNAGTFNLTSGTIANNTAHSNGGGIYNGGGFTMLGGVIANNTARTGDGGGIYHEAATTLNIRNATLTHNEALNGDGGGIWLAYARLAYLYIDSGASSNLSTFSGNHASRATNRMPGDNSLYEAHIFTNKWSSSLAQGYNNYDISYPSGTTAVIVTFKIISLNHSNAYKIEWPATISAGKIVAPNLSELGDYPANYVIPLWYENYNPSANAFSGSPWDFNTDISARSGELVLYGFDNVAFDNPSAVRTLNHGVSLHSEAVPFSHILVKQDITLMQTLTISSSRNLTYHSLSGTEVTLTTDGNYRHFEIFGGGVVDLGFADSTVILSGQAFTSSGSFGGGVGVGGGDTWVMLVDAVVEYCKNQSGGAIYVDGGSRLELYGGILRNNTAESGGGIYNGGSVAVFGGMISNNTAFGVSSAYGGGVYNSGIFEISGITAFISNNTAKTTQTTGTALSALGGGIYNSGSLTIVEGTITNNSLAHTRTTGTLQSWGGGIYNQGGNIALLGGTISNHAVTQGGGIYNQGGSVVMSGGMISNNTATSGGGIYHTGIGNFTMLGGMISSNTATTSGGGIINFGRVFLLGGVIANNTATSTTTYGGGIYNQGGNIVMFGGMISNNTATSGGGIYNQGSSGNVTVLGGVIANNTATNSGGGILNFGLVTMVNGTITNNTATNGGGISNSGSSSSGDVTVLGGVIANNTATSGGGIYNTGGSANFTLSGGTIAGNTADNGGGIYLEYGLVRLFGGMVANNTAVTDGGGVWVARTRLANLFVDSEGVGSNQTVFLGNVASRATNRLPADDAIYASHIFTSQWSNPLTQGYNNYDISYPDGSTFVDLSVTFKLVSLDSSGAYQTQWVGTIEDNRVVQPNPVNPSGTGGYPLYYDVPLWYIAYNESANVFLGDLWDFSTDVSALSGELVLYGFDNVAFDNPSAVRTIGHGVSLHPGAGVFDHILVKNNINLAQALPISTSRDLIYHSLTGAEATLTTNGNYRHFDISAGDVVLGFADSLVVLAGQSPTGDGAEPSGGGINISGTNTNVVLVDAIIQFCKNINGGAVYIGSGSNLALASGILRNNTAANGTPSDRNGGGVYIANGGNFSLLGGEVSGNTAYGVGGGVSNSFGQFTMTAGTITSNTANGGGGVYTEGNFCSVLGGTIVNNTAIGVSSAYGGGVYNSGTLEINGITTTISNNTVKTTQTTGTTYLYSYGGGIYNTGDLTVVEGTITNNIAIHTRTSGARYNHGGGIYNDGGAITIADGVISNNTANHGGGIYTSGSEVVVSGGVISNNEAISSGSLVGQGGGVYSTGSFSLSGESCVIANNLADQGGGVYIDPNSFVLSANGCVIANNTAVNAGGGVYVQTGGSFELSGEDCVIADNIVTGLGGGVCVAAYSSFVLSGEGCVIANNTATFGGGVDVVNNSSFVLSGEGCVIANNTATFRGGGVHVTGSFVLSEGCVIANNTAPEGGGVYVTYQCSFVLSEGGVVANNTADFGGGVYTYGYFELFDGVIVNNTAPRGGGVYVGDLGSFALSGAGGVIANNTAAWGGGVYSDGPFTMSDGVLLGNTAVSGGGIYVPRGSINVLGGVISSNQAFGNGGGVWVTDSTTNLARIFVGDGVVFSNNTASAAYQRAQEHDGVYVAQIGANVTWTPPFVQGYNNFDISYVNGEPFKFSDILVSFDVNPFDESSIVCDAPERITVTFEAPYGVLPSVECVGYSFEGWFTEASGGMLIDEFSVVELGWDHTLFARWVAWGNISYVVHYYLDGTSISVVPDRVVFDGTMAASVTEVAVDVLGYSVLAPVSVTASLNVSGNVFVFYYALDVYTITYVLDAEGVNHPSNPVSYSVEDVLPICIVSPSRVGFVFLGWRVDFSNGSWDLGPIFSFNITEGTVGDLLLSAVWLSIPLDVPVGVDGRVLSGSVVGDCSVWVEVARYGDCSLIVRKNYLNIANTSGYYGDLGRQVCSFGGLSGNAYGGDCLVRGYVNAWFSGEASELADSLPVGARMRGYAMRHDAVLVVGSSNVEVSLFDGFSRPTVLAGAGEADVAFVLSFSEVANFMSRSFFDRNAGFKVSSFVASANYAKLSVPFVGCGMWLRSPGEFGSVVGCLDSTGRVSQYPTGGDGFVYPAVWVHSSIFEL